MIDWVTSGCSTHFSIRPPRFRYTRTPPPQRGSVAMVALGSRPRFMPPLPRHIPPADCITVVRLSSSFCALDEIEDYNMLLKMLIVSVSTSAFILDSVDGHSFRFLGRTDKIHWTRCKRRSFPNIENLIIGYAYSLDYIYRS